MTVTYFIGFAKTFFFGYCWRVKTCRMRARHVSSKVGHHVEEETSKGRKQATSPKDRCPLT
ncbi:hypothetical protein Pint_11165 [Pistacia integerrima]|uniref:Uncharacterized protein n=1 Tax=Pistacia integerrima TaxID=434235 RepID=A0ACC0XH19_9ROSI|nr:hypothetical protein Pint_11165 [Pistacia integerrima]